MSKLFCIIIAVAVLLSVVQPAAAQSAPLPNCSGTRYAVVADKFCSAAVGNSNKADVTVTITSAHGGIVSFAGVYSTGSYFTLTRSGVTQTWHLSQDVAFAVQPGDVVGIYQTLGGRVDYTASTGAVIVNLPYRTSLPLINR